MAPTVTIANVLASGGAPSSGSNVTASWTPSNTKQYLLAITAYSSTGSTPPVISSVSGNGVTWTLIDSVEPDNLGSDTSMLWVYAASGGGGSAGAITISWSTAPTRTSWSLDSVTDGGIGLASGSLPQSAVAGTSSGANPSVSLGNALQSGSVTYAAAAFESSTGTLSAGSGYVALGTVTTQSLAWLLTEWDSSGSISASASNTTTSNRHGIIEIEIAPAKFAPVGSWLTWDSTPITLTPTAVGNLILVGALTKFATSPVLSGISSSNVTWTKLSSDVVGSVSGHCGNIWIGKVTSTSAATVTLTWSTGSAPSAWQLDVHEFSSAFTNWALDVEGHVDTTASNHNYASLTPAAAGELYFGFHYDNSAAVGGTTPGFSYNQDSHGNGELYNATCGSGTQTPVWSDSDIFFGVMALIKQAIASVSGTIDVTLKKMTAAVSGTEKVSGTIDVTLKKITAAASGTEIVHGTASVTLKKMTVSASGNVIVHGTASVTLKKMTVSASGRVPVAGTAAVAMRKMVVSASGKIKIPGTISVTMRKMQVHASEGSTVTGASSLFIFSQL